jgi:Bacterial type II/III secretion system short domain
VPDHCEKECKGITKVSQLSKWIGVIFIVMSLPAFGNGVEIPVNPQNKAPDVKYQQDVNTQVPAQTIKVFQLKYKQAQQVLPLLQPMLPTGSALSGDGSTVIVRSTSQGIRTVKHLLRKIDKRGRMFLISIRQGNNSIANPKGDMSAELFRTDDDRKIQKVWVAEGKSAFVSTGQAVPVLKSGARYVDGFIPRDVNDSNTATGRPVIDAIRDFPSVGGSVDLAYEKLETGFSVTPEVVGKKVLLKIKRTREALDRFGGEKINEQQLSTTLLIPTGQWRLLGGSAQLVNEQRKRNYFSTQKNWEDNSMIYIRVDMEYANGRL